LIPDTRTPACCCGPPRITDREGFLEFVQVFRLPSVWKIDKSANTVSFRINSVPVAIAPANCEPVGCWAGREREFAAFLEFVLGFIPG